MVVRDLFRYCFPNTKPGPGQSDKNNEQKKGNFGNEIADYSSLQRGALPKWLGGKKV